jgi:hypothetical protein
MNTRLVAGFIVSALLQVANIGICAGSRPYENGKFVGRIAYSCDGNHNDPDDWAASPVALAIFAEAGLKERVVHYDYNCILPQTDLEWEKIHAKCVLGAMEKYGYDKARFFDCRKVLDAAVADLARVINESSADNPLYLIIAGPMEVPYMGIQKSDPAKRKYVYCISHSRWNDGFSSKYKFSFTKRSVIEQDVNWLQIRDQNRLLSLSPYGRPAKPEEFEGFFWMRDSKDPKVKFLWDCTLISTRPDPSDAGMAYFLVSGDEDCDPKKLKSLIEDHKALAPVTGRKQVRIEAENFRHFESYKLEDTNDKTTSHRLQAGEIGSSGSIRTRYNEMFSAASGNCEIEVRYQVAEATPCHFSLKINGAVKSSWESAGQLKKWTSFKVPKCDIQLGDEISVRSEGSSAKIDYVQLNFQ